MKVSGSLPSQGDGEGGSSAYSRGSKKKTLGLLRKDSRPMRLVSMKLFG